MKKADWDESIYLITSTIWKWKKWLTLLMYEKSKKLGTLVVIGIGGSYLGARALMIMFLILIKW
nr:hypothetical protein [Mycoplasmopsis bovis]